MKNLNEEDIVVSDLIKKELNRQETGINLIASENYASNAVLEATASVFTNKYCEGYPGKRYYPGCQYADEVELLAIERCKKLFDAEHANVQPHAGSQANMGVYFAMLNPKDTILGMSLPSGGHLTHGHSINFSGKIYNCVQYGVNKETETIDFSEIEELANKHKPKLIVAGASAYSRIIDFKKFAEIAQSVNAYLLVDMAHIAGLVAAKIHPSPVPYADFVTSTTHKTLRGPRGAFILCKQKYAEQIDKAIMPGMQGGPFMHIIAARAVAFLEALDKNFINYQKQVVKNSKLMAQKFQDLGYKIVSGGTDNHLFVINLSNKGITGKDAEKVLEKHNIYVSRSTVPFDTQKPYITSGIRIGTPAITTRGFTEKNCEEVVYIIDEILKNINIEKNLEKIKNICNDHPIYK